MKRIGQILLDQSWVSPEHLLRALNHQKLVGGRLGTCLLEMEAVEERLLLRALSIQLGVPAADVDDLRGVPEEVTALLPAKVARRCQAVPFRLLGGQLSIALLAIRDLAVQDELAFVSGKRLRIHIANEARIFEALEKYYGEECPQRFTQLLDRINRARYLWDRAPREAEAPSRPAPSASPWQLPTPKLPRVEAPAAPPVPVYRPEPGLAAPVESEVTRPSWVPPVDVVPLAPPPASLASPAAAGPSPEIQALPPASAAPVAQAPRPEPAAPAQASPAEEPAAPLATTPPRVGMSPAPATREEAERNLAEAGDRDAVGDVLVRFLGAQYSRVALLALRKDELTGWMAAGETIDQERLRGLRLPLSTPSIFATLRDGTPAFRGPLPPHPVHRELASIWGGVLPLDSLLAVIPVRGRPVAIVYVDRSPGTLLATDPEEVRHLAVMAGQSLEACIRRQKKADAAPRVDGPSSLH